MRPSLRLEILEDRTAPAVLTVNSLADSTSPGTALTLRVAIEEVDGTLGRSLTTQEQAQITGTLGNNDTILFQLPSGSQVITLTAGALSITKPVTIDGPGNLTVSANNQSRVFVVGTIYSRNLTLQAAISGLTIAKGSAVSGSNNYGGGLLNFGTLTLTNVSFTGDAAGGSGGGAIYNEGALTVTNCAFSGNSVTSGSGHGGAIENDTPATLTVNSSTFSGNTAASTASGAGIANSGAATVSGSTFSGNTAGSNGGGIDNSSGATLILTNCTFAANSAGSDGGGLDQDGTVTLSGCTFSANTAASEGGAIDNKGTLTSMINCTLYGNSAASDGGALTTSGSASIVNCTITDNRAAGGQDGVYGGGIYDVTVAAKVYNTIIAGNFRGTSPGTTADDVAGSLNSSSGYNLIGTGGSGGLVNGSNGNKVGVSNPGLGPLANNGGPTQTVALLTGSPAIDVGNNSYVAAGETDQRGLPRIVNFTVDIGAFEVQATKTSSSTSLTSGTNPSTFGQSVTFTAVVNGTGGTPTGSVTFMNGATTLGSASLTSGTATFTTATLPAGSDTISAVYNGDSTFSGSTSGALSQTVNKASSSTGVASSTNPSTFGQSVTFTATVTGTGGTPTGSVTFLDGTVTVGSASLTNGTATFATSSLPVGSDTITTAYSGDANFGGSTSIGLTQTVNKASSSTGLTSSTNPSTLGQSVTFTASVSGPGGTPTGSITFLDGTTSLGSATLAGGTASFATTSLSSGSNSITAVYNGDGNYNGSTSAVLTQSVKQANSSTAVTSGTNPSTFGQSVTFTATVTGTGGTPTGSVTFLDGASTLGSATLTSGTATFTTSSLPVGSATITAVYSGDGTFNGSTSAGLTQTVNKASSSTGVTSGTNPSTFGQSVTFTATVTVTVTTAAPTGSVTFMDGATTLGSASLTSGTATFTTAILAGGSHTITAVYSGDGNFSGSTSAGLTQTVNKASSSTGLTSSTNPSTLGQNVTFTATVSGPGGTPTGSVTFMDGTTTLGTAALTSGTATFSTSSLPVGSDTITAVYSGDGNHNGSTSAGLSQTVNPSSNSGVPTPAHVVIVIDENTPYDDIIGNTTDAPYINSLAQSGALFTNSYGINDSESQPNYLALFSGSTQNVTDDGDYSFDAPTLATSLIAKGLTFGGYFDGLPSVGYTGDQSGDYVRWHNPLVSFTNVPSSLNMPFTSFPTNFNQLPTVSFVVPDEADDMTTPEGTIASGDAWLQANISAYATWAKSNNSLLIFTFDQDDGTENDHITTIFTGPMVQTGTYSEMINHYNIWRTVEDMYGLSDPGSTAAPITDVWNNVTAPSPAVLTVNSLADTTSAGTALTLREAVEIVDGTLGRSLTAQEQAQISGTLGNNDTIEFSLPSGPQTIALTGGPLDITQPVSIVGPGAANLTISGNSQGRDFIVGTDYDQDLGLDVSIGGLTIAKGSAGSGSADYGGGLLNFGTLSLSNATFSGDSAGNSGGGGIYNDGALTVTDCSFTSDSVTSGGPGGGIQNSSSATMTVTGCTFTGNTGSGGASGAAMANSGLATVTSSTFSNNTSDSNAGGIYNGEGATLTVSNCTFTDNTSGADGAAIDQDGTATVSDSCFVGNSAASEGGFMDNKGTLLGLTNCTIYGNSAVSDGGGLATSGSALIENCTITDNRVTSGRSGLYGGGIYDATVAAKVYNTIVAGNFRGASPSTTADDVAGSLDSSSGYNLIGTGGSGGLVNGSKGNQVGVSNPGLGTLANNGGPTQTLALLPGSPAIDAGSNAYVSTGETDQRGLSRIVNGTVDIGAFEVQITAMPPSNQTATHGTATSFLLGTFADASAAGPWSAIVNWGDNSSNTTFTTPNQGTLPSEQHNYQNAGTYKVIVTIKDANNDTVQLAFLVTVS